MKHTIFRNLITLGLYPHIGFTYSPFKILEFKAMLAKVEFQGDERVLDIGCGDGLHTLLLGQKVGHITGIDVNSEFVATARSYADRMGSRVEADFRDQPLEQIQFPDNHFDIIFSICVIEHIDNYEEVLQECLRILKPGGRIIFTVDTLESIADTALIEAHRQAHHVVQYFRSDTLSELLADTGFKDIVTENMFRSSLACSLFTQGIRRGFNFGRIRTQFLTRQMAKAEAQAPLGDPGIFLLATASRPSAS